MANVKNFGLIGTGSTVQLGKSGNQIKNGSGLIQARNAADNAYVKLQGADPTLFVDMTTDRYVRTHGHVLVTGQIDGGSPPAVVDQAVYICTTSGGSYVAGRIYYGENATWNEVTPLSGTSLSPSTDLTGGTLEFTAGNNYIYNAGTWENNTPIGSVLVVRGTLAFDSAGTVNIGVPLAVDSRFKFTDINVTTSFDGTGPLPVVTIGYSGQESILADTTDSDLTEVDLFHLNNFVDVPAGTQMIATFTAGGGATQGAADIELTFSIG